MLSELVLLRFMARGLKSKCSKFKVLGQITKRCPGILGKYLVGNAVKEISDHDSCMRGKRMDRMVQLSIYHGP